MTAIDLTGRHVLLTGASRGLGESIARAIWQLGAHLFLVARSERSLSHLKDELLREGRADQSIDIFPVDLADSKAPEAILSGAQKSWKRLDVLINNAAIQGPIGKLWENPWGEWKTTIDINLLAPVALCRAVLPWMMEFKKGKIINLSGGGATAPRPNFSAYGTAKAALVRFSEILAHELHDQHIQVNCIAPGAMKTKMTEAVKEAGPAKAGPTEYKAALDSLEREESVPHRAVELCCFLASPASDFITGKLISAVWDPWENLSAYQKELNESDIYTLRRIVPRDRGQDWG
jgi:NAD(P)-dependent dehydrogenase (short-subunit alcohol dehydrogenase family)